jgi:hypothetical protein
MSNEDPVYEMLWDCRHCGAKKLLGLTHRYCPECGSPQNAEFRYFPSEQDKVAVRDHVYYGADVVCRYCGTYNSKNAKHCKDCGGPLVEGTAAETRTDQVHAVGQYQGESIQNAQQERSAAGAPAAAPPPKKKSLAGIIVGAVLLGLVALGLVAMLWKRDASFTVASHSWQREIDVERFGPVKDSSWCDELPAGANNVNRYRAVRSHENVQVGEDCSTRKVDNGDGTFKEKRECKPRYEKKPVEDDKCDFTVDKWSRSQTLTSKGAALTPEPTWPAVTLTRAGCASVGCEREGPRRESYTVVFKNDEDGETGECKFDQAKWQSYAPGKRFSAKVGVVGSWLDCDSLTNR